MTGERHFDALILGGGESGKWMAWTLSESGSRTALIEREYIGGSCPNIACLPSKNEIAGARVASLARQGARYGVQLDSVSVDMRGVRERKRRMVDGEVAFHLERFQKTGVQLIRGEGHFVAPKEIEVRLPDSGSLRLSGERVFIDVGTHAAIPEIPGLREAGPMTHIQALELDRVPNHLIVLGGGSVALELAQAIRRFGARVTVVVRGQQLASKEDPDAGEAFHALFRDEGIDVIFGSRIVSVEGRSGERVSVRLDHNGEEQTVEGTDLLVAVGRTPNTQGIGLDYAGVQIDSRGFIRVNDRLETTAPGTWAMGECAGSPQFTHVAFDDFRVVSENLKGGNRSTASRIVPYCLFTDPEYVRVGISETEAGACGIRCRVFRLPMAAVLRSATTSEPRGFLKALVAVDSDRILGFSAMGFEASELLAAVQTAMVGGLPYTSLRDAIFSHPTVAEGLVFLFRGQPTLSS